MNKKGVDRESPAMRDRKFRSELKRPWGEANSPEGRRRRRRRMIGRWILVFVYRHGDSCHTVGLHGFACPRSL